MQTLNLKRLKQIIALSILTFTLSSASQCNISSETLYSSLSTAELQYKVEQLSNEGKLPLDMALELINRWTNKRIS